MVLGVTVITEVLVSVRASTLSAVTLTVSKVKLVSFNVYFLLMVCPPDKLT